MWLYQLDCIPQAKTWRQCDLVAPQATNEFQNNSEYPEISTVRGTCLDTVVVLTFWKAACHHPDEQPFGVGWSFAYFCCDVWHVPVDWSAPDWGSIQKWPKDIDIRHISSWLVCFDTRTLTRNWYIWQVSSYIIPTVLTCPAFAAAFLSWKDCRTEKKSASMYAYYMTASTAFSINSQLLDAAMHGTNVLDDLFLWSVTQPSGPLKERSLQRFLLCIWAPNQWDDFLPDAQHVDSEECRNAWWLIWFEIVFRNAFDCHGQDPSLPSSRELDAIFRANLDSHGGRMAWDHRKSFPHTPKNIQ